jgi:hypothetical protein
MLGSIIKLAVLLTVVLGFAAPALAVSPGSINAAIMSLAAETAAVEGIPKARAEGLQKALLKAIENISLGAEECALGAERKADNRYRYARGWLLSYKKNLASGSVGLGGSALDLEADAIIEMIDELIATICAGDDPPVNTNEAVLGVGGKPR